jgi:hypothetical protein
MGARASFPRGSLSAAHPRVGGVAGAIAGAIVRGNVASLGIARGRG